LRFRDGSTGNASSWHNSRRRLNERPGSQVRHGRAADTCRSVGRLWSDITVRAAPIDLANIMSHEQHPTLQPVRIGCSGWNYKAWRGEIYPPGLPASRWLEQYATLFDTVEVNTTFYRLIAREAVARWVQQTPTGFVFVATASETARSRLTCVR
jgi:Protein of unknown function DUF72